MTDLDGLKVLLGVTGGIASYKSAYLVRRLIEAGADVRVVMTEGAEAFVTTLTFQALSGKPVSTNLLDPAAEAAMGHIELARWADRILVAPASANTIARLAHGLADDLLGTLCLASEAPLALAPAMNRQMWAHPATQHNCQLLESRGVRLFGPGDGEQACGEIGAGRMLEPDEIVQAMIDWSDRPAGASCRDAQAERRDPGAEHSAGANGEASPSGTALRGRHVVLTAGPTVEPLDPVRFLSNHSSGKMGYALARAAADAGARVTLVSGPTSLACPSGVTRLDVVTAREMHEAVMREVADADLFVAVAAVSDYRPLDAADSKLKKSADTLTLELAPNPDILADVAARDDAPFCVGFAAETDDVERYARGKLERKRLDMIAANRVGDSDAPVFGSDETRLEVYWNPDGHRALGPGTKIALARELIALAAARFADNRDRDGAAAPQDTTGTRPSDARS